MLHRLSSQIRWNVVYQLASLQKNENVCIQKLFNVMNNLTIWKRRLALLTRSVMPSETLVHNH